ncbi:PepSY domain-containing protein [Afifella marina]|uniref:PepSY domain-containing protein n=1 Tax=Afifella marina DSM 2698 TaxID=1120955 RepID=A0A1G5P978_AFIMA|nr:PepSY domain-containing protein [Afifella marina]MBK1624394.1 PepSY domain-containing protein [Afifella marina DSM 2698]MBK1628126.1 PepSY domain-containing protein [Afifella marina]MBK5916560.1 hypothetical protein [Afifella marina]RAI19035.1 hypothetical protein CH311_13735 [Afifella marina DSM 2698]SCZ46123.1 hypothetical protein SAMN03080610_03568 [Afifella marina DSM 2698]
MKKLITATVLTLGAMTAGTAFASDDARCNAPMAERQPREALQQQLETKGWEVRQIKTEDGCYEAYAIDDQGKRVEAYFDPKTLKMVRQGRGDRD